MPSRSVVTPILAFLMAASLPAASGASRDLGNGFRDHGVAVPISNHRGMAATVDGDGRNVLLAWLMDHTGGYELLMLDAETGKAEEFPIPFDNVKRDSPYASLLSSANRFYTHFGDHFVEFDPAKRAFTFSSKTTPQMSMGMTEDDNGVIWSVSYPDSGVVSYDPKTKTFRDYGSVYPQNWPQYQRFVAADDAGWIYFALGMTATQIVALDPATGKAMPMLPEEERTKGTAYVYRDLDGKVYGQASQGKSDWYVFHKGKGRRIGKHENRHPKPIITGNQTLAHLTFPDGSQVKECNLVDRTLVVLDAKTSEVRRFSFDYRSDGAIVMGVGAAPDGTLCGGTAFPMRFFSLDPKTDRLINRKAYGQWNTIAVQGDRFFVGGYPSGYLLEWEPSKPWVDTERDNPASNPRFLTQISPVIHRPHRLLALSDGRTVIMGGTPQYGYTGGGLLIWDRATSSQVVLEDKDLIPDQSVMSLVELPGGRLLAGTTTHPGTGGEKKAKEAELYILDLKTKKVEWHAPVFPGAQEYTDLYGGPEGQVYGFADKKIFFVFDPARREVILKQDVEKEFGPTTAEQCPRVFVSGPDQSVYVLFRGCIARLDTTTHKLSLVARSPVPIFAGGDYFDGRIYFINESHLCSYQLGAGQ